MNKKEAESAIRNLRDKIDRHNRKYYLDANPEISDFDFDKLMRDLISLEQQFPEFLTPDSPSQRVGGAPLK